MIRILIGGDVCPMGRIGNEFVRGNAKAIFGDLTGDISNADFAVVNLECPLITKETPIAKSGPVLGASIECVKGFAASGCKVLNLANNHIFDHGADGLRETMRSISRAGLGIVGAGENLEKAQIPYVASLQGARIVVYAMAEHEFSIAGEKSPGVNPLDMINFTRTIQRHKRDGIFIVLIHGGQEHYLYPSPEMVRRCRFMIDMGADAVICCHAHCPQPWEIYSGRPIVYGLGNLVFELDEKMPESWYEGYLAALTIDNAMIHFEPIPYFQSKELAGARKMSDGESKKFLAKMHIRCARLGEPGFINRHWAEYCGRKRNEYLAMLFAYNKIMTKMKGLLLKKLHSKEALLCALNLVQCESHREVLEGILGEERREG